jgi:SAM-dependent methyltransferase
MSRLLRILDAATRVSIDLRDFDFVDFGASNGGSVAFAKKYLGGKRGVAIDIDPAKASLARANGVDAVTCDATEIAQTEGQVRFAILSHFLEHLPNLAKSLQCVRSAIAVSTDFVYIQQPWFDSDEYLERKGFKLYWSDWTGHRNHMLTRHFATYLDAMQMDGSIAGYTVWGHTPIVDSMSPDVHTLDTPRNQGKWDTAKHGPKPSVTFNPGVFRELHCFIRVRNDKPIGKLERQIIARSGEEWPIIHGKRCYPPHPPKVMAPSEPG